MTNKVIRLSDLSNEQFLTTYAKPGRVGLIGGETLIEKVIRRAERHLDATERWSLWSHAMLFEGVRADGQHWVIESDLALRHKHIKLGVQENRVAKYFNEKLCRHLAVLDFGLTDEQVAKLLQVGLEMVANRTRYSLRELVGTLVGLHQPKLRPQRNLLAQEKSCYCSAFIQHVFQQIGIDLAPGIHASQGTPEDISRTPVPHTTYLLQRV